MLDRGLSHWNRPLLQAARARAQRWVQLSLEERDRMSYMRIKRRHEILSRTRSCRSEHMAKQNRCTVCEETMLVGGCSPGASQLLCLSCDRLLEELVLSPGTFHAILWKACACSLPDGGLDELVQLGYSQRCDKCRLLHALAVLKVEGEYVGKLGYYYNGFTAPCVKEESLEFSQFIDWDIVSVNAFVRACVCVYIHTHTHMWRGVSGWWGWGRGKGLGVSVSVGGGGVGICVFGLSVSHQNKVYVRCHCAV